MRGYCTSKKKNKKNKKHQKKKKKKKKKKKTHIAIIFDDDALDFSEIFSPSVMPWS
jgi:hypothetical protein